MSSINYIRFPSGNLWTEVFGDRSSSLVILIAGAQKQGIYWSESWCNAFVQKGYCVVRFDHRDTGFSTHIDFNASPYRLQEYRQFYQFVYWMDGSSKREFLVSCISLLKALGIKVPEENEENEDFYFSHVLGLVNTFLPQHKKNWLLLVDNIEESDFVTEFAPNGGHVLYTSRNREWLKRLEIDVFKPDESVAYLLQMTGFGESHKDAAMALSIELDHLPLALAQAAAYISRQRLTSFTEYLEQYREQYAYLLAQNQIQPSLNKRTTIVMTTWNTTMKKLSESSHELMGYCAYLAPTAIPTQLLRSMFSVDDVIDELFTYSMIKKNEDDSSFFMHRLVQTVVRDTFSKEKTHEIIKMLFSQLRTQMTFEEYTPETWAFSYLLTPHLEKILIYSEENVATSRRHHYRAENDQPFSGYMYGLTLNFSNEKQFRSLPGDVNYTREYYEGKSALFLILGRILRNQGFFSLAKEKLERSYDHAMLAYGTTLPPLLAIIGGGIGSADSARTLDALGSAFSELGQYKQQIKCFEKALEISKKTYGEEHPFTAVRLNNLGGALSMLGEHLKAKNLCEKALAIYEQIYGDGAIETASILNTLGVIYGKLKQYVKERDFLIKALSIYENAYGKDHVCLAPILNNLAVSLGNLRQYEEEAICFKRALDISTRIYGERDYRIATIFFNMGSAFKKLNRYKEAAKYLEKALEIDEDVLGREHPHVIATIQELAELWKKVRAYEKQKDCLEQLLEIYKKKHGEQSSNVGSLLNDLGSVFEKLKRYADQIRCLERSLAITKSVYGENHPNVVSVLNNLGFAFANLSRYEEQKDYIEKALILSRKIYGDHHFYVGRMLNNLGSAYERLAKYKEKKDCLVEALPLYEQGYGMDHPELGAMLYNLGVVSEKLNEDLSALSYLQRALMIEERVYDKSNSNLEETVHNLGNILGKLERYEEQKVYLKRALVMRESIFNPDHTKVAETLRELGQVCMRLEHNEEAKDYFMRILRIYGRTYNIEHQVVGELLDNLIIILQKIECASPEYEIGNMYMEDKQFKNAYIFYEQAIAKHYIPAKSALGTCYFKGFGVPKNIEKATDLYRESAFEGDAKGQYNYGVCLMNGYGIDKNEEQGLYWYQQSAAQGYQSAINALRNRSKK